MQSSRHSAATATLISAATATLINANPSIPRLLRVANHHGTSGNPNHTSPRPCSNPSQSSDLDLCRDRDLDQRHPDLTSRRDRGRPAQCSARRLLLFATTLVFLCSASPRSFLSNPSYVYHTPLCSCHNENTFSVLCAAESSAKMMHQSRPSFHHVVLFIRTLFAHGHSEPCWESHTSPVFLKSDGHSSVFAAFEHALAGRNEPCRDRGL